MTMTAVATRRPVAAVQQRARLGRSRRVELKARPGVPQAESTAVERKIASAFGRQASLDARRIHVTVHDSTAVLSGHVHSFAEEQSARNAAYAAPGITKVENRLTVEP